MSSHVVTPNTEAAILARVIESDPNAITPDVARYLLPMQLRQCDRLVIYLHRTALLKRLAPFALALMACAAPLWCATLERLSFDDLATKSRLIVRGKVSDTWTALTNGTIFTHYRVQVSETFKGTAGNSVEVMVPGGALNGLHQSFFGAPVLNKGDEFVLFLWTSIGGITWITGLTQGLFKVPADGTSDPTAKRPASPELMLDPITARPVKDAAVSMRLSDMPAKIAAALAKGGAQ